MAKKSIVLGLLLLAALAWLATPAMAAVDIGTGTFVTTIGAWKTAGTFIQQDKLWTINFDDTTTLPDGTPIIFSFTTLGGIEHHVLQILTPPGEVNGPGVPNTPIDYLLDYLISVAPGNPGVSITHADLNVDVDGSTGTWSVSKTFEDGSAVLHDSNLDRIGSTQVLAVDFPGVTSIDVDETFTFDSASVLQSVSNSYTQSVVPEPATLLVWTGLGGIAAAAAMRRRKQPSGRWSNENRTAICSIIERGRHSAHK
jgi:hypothetical protein